MVASGYSLHLYCEEEDEHEYPNDKAGKGEFNGQTRREVLKDAREAGWKVNRGLTKAWCRQHAKGKK